MPNFCSNCGHQFSPDARFCGECGTVRAASTPTSSFSSSPLPPLSSAAAPGQACCRRCFRRGLPSFTAADAGEPAASSADEPAVASDDRKAGRSNSAAAAGLQYCSAGVTVQGDKTAVLQQDCPATTVQQPLHVLQCRSDSMAVLHWRVSCGITVTPHTPPAIRRRKQSRSPRLHTPGPVRRYHTLREE